MVASDGGSYTYATGPTGEVAAAQGGFVFDGVGHGAITVTTAAPDGVSYTCQTSLVNGAVQNVYTFYDSQGQIGQPTTFAFGQTVQLDASTTVTFPTAAPADPGRQSTDYGDVPVLTLDQLNSLRQQQQTQRNAADDPTINQQLALGAAGTVGAGVALGGGLWLFGAGAGATAAGGAPLVLESECAGIGANFGRLGTVIENPGATITSFSQHAEDMALERGMTIDLMNSVVRSPQVVLQQINGTFLYLSGQGAVVLNQAGRVVTTYSPAWFDASVLAVLGATANGG